MNELHDLIELMARLRLKSEDYALNHRDLEVATIVDLLRCMEDRLKEKLGIE